MTCGARSTSAGAFIVAAIVQGIMAGAQGGLFTEIFRIRPRYSGMSIAYQIGRMIGGAVTPLVATGLYGAYRSSTPIGLYVSGISLLSLLAMAGLWACRHEAHEPTPQTTPSTETRRA